MKSFLRILLGAQTYCRMFHVSQFGNTIEWYGRWCRPCGIYRGADRRGVA